MPPRNPVIAEIIRQGLRQPAGKRRRLTKAALETGWVETRFQNLHYGMQDSLGWRGERQMYYKDPLNLKHSVSRFYREAKRLDRGQPVGQLAAAVQRPAAQYRYRYGASAPRAERLLRRFFAGGAAGTGVPGGGTPASVSRSPQGAGGSALAELSVKALQRQQGPPSYSLPAPPVHTARVTLPEGQATGPPQSGLVTPVQQAPSVQDLLAAAQQDASVADAKSTVTPGTPGSPGAGPSGGGSRYPLAQRGKIIGVPYQGTHTLGNWQSDNAVDIAVPVGTKVLSSVNGRVVKVNRAHAGDTGRFGGIAVTLQGPSRGIFYTHLSAASVRVGQTVSRGQVIGRSGSANGVAHLHYGISNGDPRELINRGSGSGGVPSGGGRVRVAAGANRPGVNVRPVVTRFLSQAAGIAGIPITITTGTNHNRMTTTGNVSDHWDGHAGDIAVPVDSRRGDVIAAAVLMAAGVPRGRAVQMARHGGAFTLHHGGHRIQIIWKSYVGGNHHDHVHVGIR